jgi:hypothetical protein
MKITQSLTIILAALVFAQYSYAQDTPSESCQAAAELAADGDIDGAIEEARWCLEGLEQIKQEQSSAVFPDEINGFTGDTLESNSAMGVQVISRDYRKGENTISVTLTGGSGGGMGGFAALAQMGMMGGGKKIRVQRRTVLDNSEGSDVSFMASLNSGAMLMFESSDTDNATVLEFIKAFPIAELDEAQ